VRRERTIRIADSGDCNGELLAAPLTSVAQPAELLGRRAAEIVLDLINSQPVEPAFEELRDRLTVRASCRTLNPEP